MVTTGGMTAAGALTGNAAAATPVTWHSIRTSTGKRSRPRRPLRGRAAHTAGVVALDFEQTPPAVRWDAMRQLASGGLHGPEQDVRRLFNLAWPRMELYVRSWLWRADVSPRWIDDAAQAVATAFWGYRTSYTLTTGDPMKRMFGLLRRLSRCEVFRMRRRCSLQREQPLSDAIRAGLTSRPEPVRRSDDAPVEERLIDAEDMTRVAETLPQLAVGYRQQLAAVFARTNLDDAAHVNTHDAIRAVRRLLTGNAADSAFRFRCSPASRRAICKPGNAAVWESSASRPLADHIRDFVIALSLRGRAVRYVGDMKRTLYRIAERCGFITWSEVSTTAVEAYFESRALADYTRVQERERWRAFGFWMLEEGRVPTNPFSTPRVYGPAAVA